MFSDQELLKILAPFTGQELSAESLQQARRQLTLFYIQRGYINSGVLLPDQQVKAGVVTLQILEGTLGQVNVRGNEGLDTDYIRDRIQSSTENEVININTLQERLQVLQLNPVIQRINAELKPSSQLSKGILEVEVSEASPYRAYLQINNHRSPSIGSFQGIVDLSHLNLLGWSDVLHFRYRQTEGAKDAAIDYRVPVTRWDTTISFAAEQSDSEVIADPFSELDIESESASQTIGIRQPLYKTPSSELALELQYDQRSSKTFLLGEKFSFSRGVENGESEVSVARFIQEWVDRNRLQVLALRSRFSFGLDQGNATVSDNGDPDGLFSAWLGQFQWLRRFSFWDSQLLFRGDAHLANDHLLSLERFSIGGANSVRGYRENLITADNGWVASLEGRITMFHLPFPGISEGIADGAFQLAMFGDYGRGWNATGTHPEPDFLASLGLGLRWFPTQRTFAELYWANAHQDIEVTDDQDDPQDRGIHLNIRIQAL